MLEFVEGFASHGIGALESSVPNPGREHDRRISDSSDATNGQRQLLTQIVDDSDQEGLEDTIVLSLFLGPIVSHKNVEEVEEERAQELEDDGVLLLAVRAGL